MVCQVRKRARTRAAGPEPIEETGAGANQTLQFWEDILAPMAARMRTHEDFMASFIPPPPPPEGPAVV